jgi:hypothetical protein
MITKTMVATVLVLVALVTPWGVDRSVAAPLPDYFADGWVGFACANAVIPGQPTAPLLLQLNFDKLSGGGITQTRANNLFTRITGSLGWLSQITGVGFQVTCTQTPNQVQASTPGLNALQAALPLTGSFQQDGFSFYLILDSFLSITPPYLGSDAAIVRTDAFIVLGANNVFYLGSSDVIVQLMP